MNSRTFLCCAGLSLAAGLTAQAQVFTGPYGPGGTWNAYQVVTVPVTWEEADIAAKAATASSTGLPALSTNNATGHLVQISNEDENTFVALIAAQAANSGNSAIWLGLNDIASEGEFVWSGTTGGSGPNGESVLDPLSPNPNDTEFEGWIAPEPNNSGTENAAEMRADGRWNDNKHNLATTTRKYVIEWEINAAAPLEGAVQHPVYYTAPHGAGGKWNLYRVVATGTTSFSEAHDAAINSTAAGTGVAGVTNGALTGHVISINSEAENSFLYRITGMSGNNSITTWLGATDDPTYGGTEAGTSKTTGWVWAGTTEPFTYQRFRTLYPNNGEEPNNGGDGENFVEQQATTGWWNDIAGEGTVFRRYVIEWNTEQDAPISGASQGVPVLPAPLPALANADAEGTWAIKVQRGAANTDSANAGANIFNALGVVYGNSAGATVSEGTAPVLNMTDGVTGDTAGRSLQGLFWPRLAYPGDPAGDTNQFVVTAKTKVTIPAPGRYAFNVHCDDGFLFRLSGGDAGAFSLVQVDGLGHADPGDPGVFYYPANSDATGARGIYSFTAAGTYQVEFLGYEGSGGSFFEVSWAAVPGEFTAGTPLGDWGANWKLLGGPQGGAPILPAGELNVAAPAGAQWSVAATDPDTAGASVFPTLESVVAALQSGTPPHAGTFPAINFADPEEGGNRGRFSNDAPFPGNVEGTADNNFALGGRGRVTITEPGLYTIGCHADDLFGLRVKGGPGGAVWRGRVWGVTAQGFIDSNDSSTIHWLTSADSNVRAVILFPAAGTYELDLVYAEGTGGAAIELYIAKGVVFADADTADWQLIGDPAALTPVLPATLANAPAFGDRLWGIHTVHDSGATLSTLGAAVTALQGAAGVHTNNATARVLNFADAVAPGAGGIFAGDLPVPGSAPDAQEDDFALHARGRLEVTTAGRYTFGIKSSDGFALRIQGGKWVTYAGNAGIDPADSATLSYGPASSTQDAAASSDRTSRGAMDLAVGVYEVDFVTFNREQDFHAEVYVAPGNNAGTGEYAAAGTANEGGAAISLNGAWRLLGRPANAGGLSILGMDSAGWKVEQSAPQAAAPAGGWNTLEAADAWLSGGAPIVTTSNNVVQINYNDPGFGGPGSIPNDRPNPTNGTANVDDNYYATRMTGNLVVPAAGTYAIGFQSDDGQYFEFTGTGANIPIFTRLTANASNNGVITASTDGVDGARIEVNIGTGNSRTIGEVTFAAAGTYPVRAVWFEGTGGSYNEIFAAPSPADGRPVFLLTADGAGNVADVAGLSLAAGGVTPPAGDLRITSVVLNAAGALEITWDSVPGAAYRIESNPNLTGEWTAAEAAFASGGTTTTYTTPVVNPAVAPRLFWRITQND